MNIWFAQATYFNVFLILFTLGILPDWTASCRIDVFFFFSRSWGHSIPAKGCFINFHYIISYYIHYNWQVVLQTLCDVERRLHPEIWCIIQAFQGAWNSQHNFRTARFSYCWVTKIQHFIGNFDHCQVTCRSWGQWICGLFGGFYRLGSSTYREAYHILLHFVPCQKDPQVPVILGTSVDMDGYGTNIFESNLQIARERDVQFLGFVWLMVGLFLSINNPSTGIVSEPWYQARSKQTCYFPSIWRQNRPNLQVYEPSICCKSNIHGCHGQPVVSCLFVSQRYVVFVVQVLFLPGLSFPSPHCFGNWLGTHHLDPLQLEGNSSESRANDSHLWVGWVEWESLIYRFRCIPQQQQQQQSLTS